MDPLFERKVRANSELIAKKRKQQDLELGFSGSDSDPFADGDDSMRDADYQPSPKKVKKVKTVLNNAEKLNRKQKPPRKLTPRERIERLNQKTLKNFVAVIAKPSLQSERPQSKDLSVPAAQSQLTSSSSSDEQSSSSSQTTNQNPLLNNHDDFFSGINDEIVCLDASHQAQEVLSTSPTEKSPQIDTASDCANGSSDSNFRFILNCVEKNFTFLREEILCLRKQVARIEMKSSSTRFEQNAANPSEEACLNFESTLAAEGLPIKSMDGVHSLERRLEESSFDMMPYSSKLVRKIQLNELID